jgi:hypothetical protein
MMNITPWPELSKIQQQLTQQKSSLFANKRELAILWPINYPIDQFMFNQTIKMV